MSNTGVITDCQRVKVLETPNVDSDLVCTLPCLTEVMIDLAESTEDFYKIYTATSVEGYCMKKYIAVRP